MANDIWISSDFHFNQSSILTFKDNNGELIRGSRFTCVEHMNEIMIENHNKLVKPTDKFYTLGDVITGIEHQEWMKNNWSRLNGRKNLIVGNYDPIQFMATGGFFKKIYESRDMREFGLLLTHRPLHENQLWDFNRDRPIKNIHGHLHHNIISRDHWINVCMEQTNYGPINIDELRLY